MSDLLENEAADKAAAAKATQEEKPVVTIATGIVAGDKYEVTIENPAHARKYFDGMIRALQGKGIVAKITITRL